MISCSSKDQQQQDDQTSLWGPLGRCSNAKLKLGRYGPHHQLHAETSCNASAAAGSDDCRAGAVWSCGYVMLKVRRQRPTPWVDLCGYKNCLDLCVQCQHHFSIMTPCELTLNTSDAMKAQSDRHCDHCLCCSNLQHMASCHPITPGL